MPLGFIFLTYLVNEGVIFGEIVWDIITAVVFMFAFKHFLILVCFEVAIFCYLFYNSNLTFLGFLL